MARRLPTLASLKAFEAAAKHLSFTRAAQEVHVTPTAVSHQIRGLEEFLGVKLFERSTRSVRLTEAGALYLPGVQAAFESLEAAAQRVARHDVERVLTVTTTASFTTKWLIPRLADFQSVYPDIDVRITTTTESIDLVREGVDLGVRYGAGRWPGLAAERLVSERLFPVCSPALASGDPPLREPADLARHTLLHVLAQRDDWKLWLTAAGLTGIDATRGLTFDIAMAAQQAAIDGLGVALGHTALLEGDLKSGRLVAPFEFELPSEYAYYVVYPEFAAQRPALHAFRGWLLSTAAAER